MGKRGCKVEEGRKRGDGKEAGRRWRKRRQRRQVDRRYVRE